MVSQGTNGGIYVNELDALFAIPTSYSHDGSSFAAPAPFLSSVAEKGPVIIPENPFDLFDSVTQTVHPKEQRREANKTIPKCQSQSPRSTRTTFDPPYYAELQKANSHDSYMSHSSQRGIYVQACLSSDAVSAFSEDEAAQPAHTPSANLTQGSLSLGAAATVMNPQFAMPLSCHSKSLRAQTEKERVLEMAAKLERDQLKRKCTGSRAFIGNPKPKPIAEKEQEEVVEEPVEFDGNLQKQDLLKPKAPGGLSIRRLIGNPKTKPNVKRVIAEAKVVL